MKSTERVETTQYVTKTIDSCLRHGDYNVALLLASIYANIRLRTMITEHKSTEKKKWKKLMKN